MYYDLLPRIKNGLQARQVSFVMPFSGMDLAIAALLAENGYVKSAEKKTIGRKHYIEVVLRYDGDEPVVRGFRMMSTPSRHIYRGHSELRPVRQHFGLGVLSTPRGIMTVKEAKKQKVGGEYLFEVW